MVKYIKERESATLSVVSNSSDQIVLSLTDMLNDATYDQPLTIRSEVPSGWANVTVQQGTGITTVNSVVEGAATVVYYNAIPDRGTIMIMAANMAPTLSSLSPSSATAGGAAFTLTVSGSGFINRSVVRWNGSNRTTTYVSGNQLTAAITTADIAIAGTARVTVFNPGAGGGTSNALTFTIQALTHIPPSVLLLLLDDRYNGGAR